MDSHISADTLVRKDIPFMAAGHKPKASVFDGCLLEWHPDRDGFVLKRRVPVRFVLVPRRRGSVSAGLEDGVGDPDASLVTEQLPDDLIDGDQELAVVELGGVFGRIEDLR